jgi:hypothetical protein
VSKSKPEKIQDSTDNTPALIVIVEIIFVPFPGMMSGMITPGHHMQVPRIIVQRVPATGAACGGLSRRRQASLVVGTQLLHSTKNAGAA